MKFIKNHILLTIFIFVIIIGGIITTIIFLNHDEPTTSLERNFLEDGTYGCELMYDGKNLDDEEVIRDWIEKLSTYESSIDVDSIDINKFKEGLDDEFGSAYIVKEDNIVRLYLKNGSETIEYISYDIEDEEFSVGKDLDGESAADIMEMFFDEAIKVKENKNSFTYGNFGFMLIFPSIVNSNNQKGESIENMDIDYEKYKGLGDLVCKTKLKMQEKSDNDTNKKENENSAYQQYLGKYIGTEGDYASESYVELLEDNVANININNCVGWSNYKGIYEIDTLDGTDELILYIDSFKIINGEELDMPDKLVFQLNDDNLFTLTGFLGSNSFDCSFSEKLEKIKN